MGRDLWKHHPSKKDVQHLDGLIGIVPKGYLLEPEPWHVWKTDREGRLRYVILLGEDVGMIPGGTSACIQLFDGQTKRINSWSFQTGWRNVLQDASLEYSNRVSSDVLVLHTGPVVNGRHIAKEYFAINRDGLRLVRLESGNGDLVSNEYVFPQMEIGLAPDANTVDQWVELLESKDKADVLSALVFLGGRHINGPDKSKYAELFMQLAGSTRIQEAIQRLGTSDEEWVRQAAVLASRKPLDRPWKW